MSEYTPRDAFAQGRFCESGHDMANAMTTVAAGLDEFDRMTERVRAEERERCLKAVEAVQRAMRDLADEKDPEERLLLLASANGMGGALAAIRAVSEQGPERSAE